ncbi:MAG: transketolase family protein [Candidatus Omnitrophica bacterium]|nr:transketolase family protein [Candidatus Omnitrophota bacterium]
MSEQVYARDIYGKTLVELGRRDSNVVVLDADLSGSTRTCFFGKEFPERFFNMGVAEQNMMATAAGFASCGKIVFVSTFSMFASARALDQVRNSITYNNFNIKIVASHGGLTVGEDGSSHQALEDISFMRSIPGLRVIVPCDGPETKEAVLAAYKEEGPFYIRIGRSKAATIENKKTFVLGKGCIIDEGKDVALICSGIMVAKAMQALSLLKKEGINPYLVNMPTIKPIDEELIINLSSKVKAFVVCEEHSIIGGLGCAVAEVVCENNPILVKRVGTKDVFGQSGSPDQLLKKYGLEPQDIAQAVKEILR